MWNVANHCPGRRLAVLPRQCHGNKDSGCRSAKDGGSSLRSPVARQKKRNAMCSLRTHATLKRVDPRGWRQPQTSQVQEYKTIQLHRSVCKMLDVDSDSRM